MPMKLYSIGEVAKILGIHQNTLRNWDRQGILSPVKVADKRVYSEEDLRKAQAILRQRRQFSKNCPLVGG
jgi:MerR family transcriptional regulator/heat shock protein HspR